MLEQIAEEKGETLKIAKLDVDANTGTAQNFGVTGIPTSILFKDGKPWSDRRLPPETSAPATDRAPPLKEHLSAKLEKPRQSSRLLMYERKAGVSTMCSIAPPSVPRAPRTPLHKGVSRN